MSRLFYEPAPTGKAEGYRTANYKTVSGKPDPTQYLEKISKLVPTEVIVAYLTTLGFTEQLADFQTREIVKWGVFLVCLIATPIYLAKAGDKSRPIIMHLVLSSMAFIIWAYATSGNLLLGNLHEPALSSIALVLFTLISAKVPLNK